MIALVTLRTYIQLKILQLNPVSIYLLHLIPSSEMSSAEPSAKVPATAAAPRFEWDFDVPDTPFWSDMELTVARNVIGCFRQEELDQMTFDGTLSVPDRLEYLLSQVEWKFAALEAEAAPEPLYAIDSKAWEDLLLAVATCQKFLNRPIDEEQTVAEVLGKTEGRKRLAWLGMMADLARRNGNHAASETAALEVLPVWRTHEKLGPDSPQALGMTRIIIESKWMQDGTKREEARLMLEETFTLVRGLSKSKFAKYQDDEMTMLLELKDKLEKSA